MTWTVDVQASTGFHSAFLVVSLRDIHTLLMRLSHVTSVTNRKEGKQDFCLLHLNSNKMKWSALWWKSGGTLNNINASVNVPVSQCRTGNGEQMLWKISECWLRLWFYLKYSVKWKWNEDTIKRHYPDLTSLIVLKTDSIWDACVCTRTQGIHQLSWLCDSYFCLAGFRASETGT